MILVDANLLIYAHVTSFPQHEKAKTWLDQQLNTTSSVGIPWPSLLAFMRIITNPRIFELPENPSDAWQQITCWLDHPSVWIPLPTADHERILGSILRSQDIRGNLVPDAHLAALAIEHGLIVCSTDTDFARFANLQWINPL